MNRRHIVVSVCSLALIIGGIVAAGGPPADRGATSTYKVTIQNLAATQPMSPPVLATHKQPVGMFTVGKLASPGLEAIAEDGNQAPMFNRFAGLRQATDAVDVGRPLTPSGEVVGDFTDSATVTIRARPGDKFSMATMLICTNDGFTGIDRALLPLFGSHVFFTAGYDAGTEDNTELSMDIVDPCSGLGPVSIGGDPDGNLNDEVDTQPREPIAHHPGIQEIGDLLAAHAWTDPVAKVTVTRVDPHARTFVTRLTGGGEVPPVESAAGGRARMELVGRRGGPAGLAYVLRVRDIVDVLQAHIHYGSPDENGPVVAFLFGPQDPAGAFSGLLAEGLIEEGDLLGPFAGDLRGFVEALRAGELYVNVHTVGVPSGELRGQIGAADGVGRSNNRGEMRRSAR